MELVEASLILNKKIDENAKGNGNTQSKNVYERVELALKDIARGHGDVVAIIFAIV